MEQENKFAYSYSAKENEEVQAIRKKYLIEPESKMDELVRLDGIVQKSGMVEALCFGIGGALVLGLGMCLAMNVIAEGIVAMVFGIIIGLVGIAAMIIAYPVYRKVYKRTKAEYATRILELTAELSNI